MTYNRDEINEDIILKSLSNAIQDSTPDILQSLRAELNIDSRSVNNTEEKAADNDRAVEYVPVKAKARTTQRQNDRMRSAAFKMASCAAAMIVLFGGVSLLNRTGPAFAVVGLDVNPGIELTIDKNEKVISAVAVNEDGQNILSDLRIEKRNVNSACDKVVEAMIDEGYLTDTSNSVLLSVRADDPEKGREIEKEISGKLNGFLEDSEISPAIFGQYVEADDELDKFAGTHGISIGKAWLIRKLSDEEDLSGKADSLLGLSTQELVLLGQDRALSTGTSYGTPNTSKYVGTDGALIAALEAAGLSKDDAKNIKVNFSCENGSIVYSVGFDANSCIYGFNVDALTGMVMLLDSVIPGVSAESPAGIVDTVKDLIDSYGDKNSQNRADQSSAANNKDSGSGNSDSDTNDPGKITGEAYDITDMDLDDEPGELSGDAEDIEDFDDTDDADNEGDSNVEDNKQNDTSNENADKESSNKDNGKESEKEKTESDKSESDNSDSDK